MNRIVRCAVPVVIATVVLFAIGMATRMPAIRLGINSGLHAVLAAFFYGLVVAVFEIKTAHAYPIVIGAVIEGINIGDHVTVAFGDGVPIIGRKILKLTLETGDTPGRRIGWR